jgi:Ser/Thr protein kinase RdoA (MazF antagonist)
MSISPDTAKEKYLRTHLQERYRVSVVGLEPLDRGVFRVRLQDGRYWIARVFPIKRSVAQVEEDARILRFLEQQGFPAERCADVSPVSVLYGRAILVTDAIEGTAAEANLSTLKAFGGMLVRLNLLPAEEITVVREAGSLHHYAPGGGGPEQDLRAAASWLAAIADDIPPSSRSCYDALREQVANADTCQHLPEALIHPDPVLKNLLVTSGKNLILIDWAGVGRGPRLASLASLLWTGSLHKGSWSPRRVDAIVSGYRAYLSLEKHELDRLAAVMRIRPLVFACWRYRHAVLAGRSPDGTEWWWHNDELIQAIAARACNAFQN